MSTKNNPGNFEKAEAWLHEKYPTACCITDQVKKLWLAVNPKMVENYTIPLSREGGVSETRQD